MSLLNIIQSGEGKTVEFKETLPNSQAIAKTVIAFSNTAGGKLIIGVNDQGSVVGLKQDVDVLELQDKIASIIYDNCYPNILPEIYTTTINSLVVLVIEVYRGNLLPYYLKQSGRNDGVYIRIGATNRKANHENIIELEHVKIKCSRFKGTTMDVFLDRKEYDSDLLTQLEDAENFIKNHIRLSGNIKGLQREDQYELPIEAIRESIINAVVHRDYSNSGRDIKVGVYDDMVNIVSPGSFPSTITLEDILEGRSEVRNKVLARVFKELNYIEQWGSGIRRIKSSCKIRGLKEPDILEKGDFVDVSLYRELESISNEAILTPSLTHQEEQIIQYLKMNENRATTHEIKSILNVSERRARIILSDMISKDLIERIGSTTNTHYRKKGTLLYGRQ